MARKAQAVAAAVPDSPPPVPPPPYRPESLERIGSERRVRKNTIPPLVRSIALEAFSRMPTAESSQVYTCTANDQNNQHCTMLYWDEEFPWCICVMSVILLAMIISLLFVYAPGLMHCWTARRATPVVADEDESISTTNSVHARCPRPDLSDGTQPSTATLALR